MFEKVRKNLVVSKLKITRSTILYGVIQSPVPHLSYGGEGVCFWITPYISSFCFRFFDWTRNSGQIYFCNLVYLEKEAIAFSGDSMGHLQYNIPKMQWFLYYIIDDRFYSFIYCFSSIYLTQQILISKAIECPSEQLLGP